MCAWPTWQGTSPGPRVPRARALAPRCTLGKPRTSYSVHFQWWGVAVSYVYLSLQLKTPASAELAERPHRLLCPPLSLTTRTRARTPPRGTDTRWPLSGEYGKKEGAWLPCTV